MRRQFIRIAFHDARGDADVLSIRAIIEEQIVAEIYAPAPAVEALETRRGVRRNHTLPDAELCYARTQSHNVARQFVSEDCRWHDHARVITATEDFEVRPAGERRADANKNIASSEFRDRNVFEPDILLAVEYGRQHLAHANASCG
jgi:hypothetical protein